LFSIINRIHAEFQLNKAPDYPFWFTPAQLTGRLVIDKNYNEIHYFELHLPTDKTLNIGMKLQYCIQRKLLNNSIELSFF